MDKEGEGWLGQNFLLGRLWKVAVCSRLHGSFSIRVSSRGLGGDKLLLITELLHEPRLLLGIGRQAGGFLGPSRDLKGFREMLLITKS